MTIRSREYKISYYGGRVQVEIKYLHTNGAVTWIDQPIAGTLGLDGVENEFYCGECKN